MTLISDAGTVIRGPGRDAQGVRLHRPVLPDHRVSMDGGAMSQRTKRLSYLWIGFRFGRTRWTWRPFGRREARCVFTDPALGLLIGWAP